MKLKSTGQMFRSKEMYAKTYL